MDLNESDVQDGTTRIGPDGHPQIYYSGYWVKTYDPPADTLRAKKALIEALTRRLFNHVEHGINIPGRRLNEARQAYENETDPARKRVKAAMLAGALFNRATDIFTKLVELQEAGVEIESNNALMRQCGACLQESLILGKQVLHRSGEEGIDELWGEPFRAFSIPVEAFYESRYIKIAQTMRDIDRIALSMRETFANNLSFQGIGPLIAHLAEIAKLKSQTLRTDENIFEVWADFVVATEQVTQFIPRMTGSPLEKDLRMISDGRQLLAQGCDLIGFITRARTPMPKSTQAFIARCERYAEVFGQRSRKSFLR